MSKSKKPGFFPEPNRRNKKLVAESFSEDKNSKNLSTRKALSFCINPEILKKHSFNDFIHDYSTTPNLHQYTITFAHAHLYKDSPRHCLCVKKPPHTLHAGLLNLPGGSVNPGESPHVAAMRELKEETGHDVSDPQLIGAIINGPMDSASPPFLVYVFRAIIVPGSVLSFKPTQPASWNLIHQLSTRKFVPNLRFFIPLIASDLIGFIIQDSYWSHNTLPPDYTAPRGLSADTDYTTSQATVTSLPHKISDATPRRKRASFTT